MSYLRRTQIESIIGTISPDNSTTVPLLAGEIFLGDAVSVLDFKAIGVTAISSHGSAFDGMEMQFSTDGNHWDISQKFNVTGGDYMFAQMPVQAQYFRLKYTNGPVAQTYFRVQTILHPTATIGATTRVGDAVNTQTPAQLSRAVIAGAHVSGDYHNVGVSADGRLKISQCEALDGQDFAYVNAASFTDNETKQFLFIAPAVDSGKFCHFAFIMDGKGQYQIEYYRDTVTSFDGYILSNPPVVNRNLNISGSTRSFLMKAAPTVIDKGSLISRYIVSSGKGGNNARNGPNEFVVQNGIKYLVEIKNISGSTMYISWTADVREEAA